MDKRIIHKVFEQVASRFPDRIAIQEEQEHISYQRLNEHANRLAHLLCYLGIKRGKKVGVLIPGSINLVTAMLATFKSGGIYLPVDLEFSRKRISEIFQQSKPDVLVARDVDLEELKALLDELKLKDKLFIITQDAQHDTHVQIYRDQRLEHIAKGLPEYYTGNPAIQVESDDENYIFYTSGSTGKAKGFVGCHKSLSHFIHWELKEFELNESCRISLLSPFTFDASLRDILLPLSCGGRLCIPTQEIKDNTNRLIEWITTAEVNLIHCVPSLFRLISREIGEHVLTQPVFPELQYILMAGEPLFVRDIQDWRDNVGLHVEIVNLYGTSETTLAKTFHRIGSLETDPAQTIHVGKPIDNAAILIMNDLAPCGTGETGEVFIRTPFMTKGYYNNPELNEESFIVNPLKETEKIHRTGDLGRVRKDGNLEILGRIDDQVKINGIRITLGEVRHAMIAVPGVQEAVVTTLPDEMKENNRLVGYYTGTEYTVEDWRKQLKLSLNVYAIPSFFMKLDKFPLTSNGKIDKRALPQPQITVDVTDDAPRSLLEKELAVIWAEILQTGSISRSASFLQVGGTSLKAIQLISRIYKKYQVLLKISDIFQHTTIAQQACLIGERKVQVDTIPKINTQDYYELSHSQKRLWMMEQLEEEKSAYNIPGNFELRGKLDKQALEQAFAALIMRHEILRTSFVFQDGKPKCRIRPSARGFGIDYVNMLDVDQALNKARETATKELRLPFSLDAGFLFRVRVLEVEEERHLLLFTAHHIITDGWSFNVMVRDLLTFYEAAVAQKEAVLPALPIQYKDYTVWLNKKLAAEDKENRNYWLGQFEELLPELRLPTDFARPKIKTTNGALFTFILSEKLVTGMKGIARSQEASMYMFLLSAVNILLYKYSGQNDLVIGAPISGRVHKDLEHQVGLYVNMLAIRTQMDPQQSFLDLLIRVKENLLNAYNHQLYPFDQLVQELKINRDESRSAITDVWVQHSDAHWGGISSNNSLRLGNGLEVHDFKSGYTISKVDLTFMFTDIKECMEVVLQYNTDLFTEMTMCKLSKSLERLIENIVSDPAQTLLSCIRQLQSAEKSDPVSTRSELLSTDY